MDERIPPPWRIGTVAALGLILTGVLMLPYAQNGFWFDDSLNSQTWGLINRFHSDVWSFSVTVVYAWLTEYGRILFCWPALYGFFYLVRDVLAVRLIDISLLLVHVGLTVVLLRRVGVRWHVVGFFLLFLMPLFQIRNGDDPIAAYATFSQVLGILLSVSLLLLQRWHETERTWLLIASTTVAIASMLCYEVNVIYVPIALIAVVSRTRKRMSNGYIVLAPFFCFVFADLILKRSATNAYDGSRVGSFSAIPLAYFKQLVGALPGSFYALSGRDAVAPSSLLQLVMHSKLAWIAGCVWILLFMALANAKRPRQSLPQSTLLGASVFLFITPVLIAVSSKYQSSLNWGSAHLPVYYEYFGLAILAATLIDRLLPAHRVVWALLLAIPSGVYVGANWEMNMHQSAYFDAIYREPRDSFVSALHSGLLDNVRDGDVVQFENQPIFINGNLVYQTVQKRLVVENEGATAGWFQANPRRDARRYRIWRDAATRGLWKIAAK
ncbi:hypothetical protein [Paraburkholderia nodosa]|uniref:hypothetical protein n=1 Tax=Paraburkholderia nodosa TaxID=392320 RepID=UPI000841962D|nr:hypothetical protein [Paraburkholderia nodosa]